MSTQKNDYFIKVYTNPLNKLTTIIMSDMTEEEMNQSLIEHIEENIGFDRVINWEISKLKSDTISSKKLKKLIW